MKDTRYMPVQNEALFYWTAAPFFALARLTPPPHAATPPGCMGTGAPSTFDITDNLSLGSPFFLQPFNLDRGRSRQMLVSGLTFLTFLALSSRLGIQKVLRS